MGEILERGLLIGFGLSIVVFFLALFTPYVATIFSDAYTPIDQHDTFVFTIEYGLSYIPSQTEDQIRVNISLTIYIDLSIVSIQGKDFLNITSTSKTTLLSTQKSIILLNSSITGQLETAFTYTPSVVILAFWRRT